MPGRGGDRCGPPPNDGLLAGAGHPLHQVEEVNHGPVAVSLDVPGCRVQVGPPAAVPELLGQLVEG